MSCVMGNRLILNIRLMKREMEANMQGREKSMLHFPLTYRSGEIGPESMVVFAAPSQFSNSTTFPTRARGDLELQEISK